MTETTRVTLYVVAVKREHRDDAPDGWIETLRETPGVELAGAEERARGDEDEGEKEGGSGGSGDDDRSGDPVGSSERRRVRVRATASGVTALHERVGAFCHIEPLLTRDPVTKRPPDG